MARILFNDSFLFPPERLFAVKMLVEQFEHFLNFLYNLRYLQHGRIFLKDMIDVSHILRTTGEKARLFFKKLLFLWLASRPAAAHFFLHDPL